MNKSVEELLSIIEPSEEDGVQNKNKGKKKNNTKNRTVDDFISEMGIEPGPNKVKTSVIYYMYYVVWRENLQRKKASKIAFFRHFATKFPLKRDGKQRYYLLNDSLNIDNAILKRAEIYEKRSKKEV